MLFYTWNPISVRLADHFLVLSLFGLQPFSRSLSRITLSVVRFFRLFADEMSIKAMLIFETLETER